MTLISHPFITSEIIEYAAKKYKEKTAFRTIDKTFTFQEVYELVNALSAHLQAMGFKKGDIISVQLPNCIEFALIHLAASQIGVVLNPLSPKYRKKELRYMLDHCESKAFVVSTDKNGEFEDIAYELMDDLGHLSHVIVVGEEPKYDQSIRFSSLILHSKAELKLPTLKKDDPILIMFTSGTETNPKAVLHTYETFIPTHLQNGHELKLSEKDNMYCLTPLCHMFSLPMIINGMYHGATHSIYSDYNISDIIERFKDEKITFVVAAPTHLIDLLHELDLTHAENINLRLILTGGTKIPSQLVQRLRKLLHCTIVSQWGMTEVCAGTFTRPDDDPSKSWKTVGRACPFGEVAILDKKTEKQLRNNEEGEIAFKGKSLFVEYYKNKELTSKVFTKDGYFLTGDTGYLDEDGYLYFVGRTKDIINRGGLKYHASEIEEALLMHPSIRQVAIVSKPDIRLGEKACVYISLRNKESRINLDDIKGFLLKKGYAKYKIPEYIEILDELPLTSTGKVNKMILRKRAEQYV